MKRIAILIFILSPLFSKAQLVSFVYSGDTLKAFNPSTAVTSNIITSDTTIPANYSLVVRGRLKVNSGIRLKPASGASIITIWVNMDL